MVVLPNKLDKSKPVLSMLKSNSPDKSNDIPDVTVDDAVPDFTSTIKFLILSKSFRSCELSDELCIFNSASVWVNNVSTCSPVNPIY